jgi:hypothetical protein
METVPSGERLFWVLLTVFGALFANGLFFVFGSEHFGAFLAGAVTGTVGLIGLIVLKRDRIKKIPIRLPLLIVGISSVSLLIGYIPYAVSKTYSKLEIYVLPRSVASKQSNALKDYLAHHEAHAVTVKVNSLDPEAREYAGQIFNALKQTEWNVDFITNNGEPYTYNEGLCIHEQGINAKPNDPKHDPVTLLQEAFQAAKIQVNCSGGVGGGEYKLFVLVGHRPLAIQDESLLTKLGRWIVHLEE